nr:unnamed protein product [Spirometra erinaceieuropaei]
MKIPGFILFMYCVIGFAQEDYVPLSDGLEDNVVTSLDSCQWDIYLDDLHIPCNNESCKSTVDESIEVEYEQTKDGRHYEVEGKICKPENYFRIGWQVDGFNRSVRKTLLTQFIAPRGDWTVNSKTCIQPQYSLPLIRTINESSRTIVKCAIRKSLCNTTESVAIFDLNGEFCAYNDTVKTCEKTHEDNDIVVYATTVYNTAPNKYFPDQYIFCNTLGSYMSIKITWNPNYGKSNGLEDNVITVTGQCIWVESNLPETLAKLVLDRRSLRCEDGWCRARGDDDMQVEYQQERVGKSYLTKAKICTHNNPFSIGWQLNDFHVDNRITRITQFFAPNEDCSTSEFSCIRPQYSLPLIRNVTEGSGMQVQCAISRKICGSSENVIIFDLNKVFCQYDRTVQTCERTEVDNDTILFSTTVWNTEPNKYYPDQYVFCNAMGSDMSIKVTWSRDVASLTTIETAAESTLILDACIGLSNGHEVELSYLMACLP